MVAMCGFFSSFIMSSRRLRQACQNQSSERVTQNANRWYLNSWELPKKQLGDRVVVAHPGQPGHWGVVINVDKKPFDDERVRKALSLAIDRYDMARTLGPLTSLDTVGGLVVPGTPWALTS